MAVRGWSYKSIGKQTRHSQSMENCTEIPLLEPGTNQDQAKSIRSVILSAIAKFIEIIGLDHNCTKIHYAKVCVLFLLKSCVFLEFIL